MFKSFTSLFSNNKEKIETLENKIKILSNNYTELEKISANRGALLFSKNTDLQLKNMEIKELRDKLEIYTSAESEKINELISSPIASWQERLVVSNHAVNRYKERVSLKISEEDMYKQIKKMFIKQYINMDYIEDGTYTLEKNVTCRVKDNTITTITYRQGLDRSKFRNGRSLASNNVKKKK